MLRASQSPAASITVSARVTLAPGIPFFVLSVSPYDPAGFLDLSRPGKIENAKLLLLEHMTRAE
jgi:hypothetical protein